MIQSNQTLTINQIKQIVKNAIKNKNQRQHDVNKNYQLFTQLYAKKKLRCPTKLQKMRKQMKIFSQLESYINFQEVYDEIIFRIVQKYRDYQKRENQQNKSKQFHFNQQLLMNVIDYQTYKKESFQEIIDETNRKIQSSYGPQFRKQYNLEAENIQKILKEIPFNLNFSSNHFHKRQKILSNSQKSPQQNTKNKRKKLPKFNQSKPKTLKFNKIDQYQISIYCRQALTFLALQIENLKKSSSIHRKKQNKIQGLTQDTIMTSDLKAKKTYQLLRPKKMQTKYTTSLHSSFQSEHYEIKPKNNKSQNQSRKISITSRIQKRSKLYQASKSVQNSFYKQEQSVILKKNTSLQKSNFIVTKTNIQKSNSHKINHNQYFNRKINKIINELQKQTIYNKLKRKNFLKFINDTSNQYCKFTANNQIQAIVKQVQQQIIINSKEYNSVSKCK